MADRYWVGGTGDWDASNTTNWSTTSGGTGGASVPTSNDDVFFDANSGSGTATVGASINCANLNFTGYTGTFAGGSWYIYVHGSLTLAPGMTHTYGGRYQFQGSPSGATITSAGHTISRVIINGTGDWTLQDNLVTSFGVSNSFTLVQGTVSFNNFNVTYSGYLVTLGSGTKVLNAGTGTLTGSGISVSSATNQTLNTSSSSLIINTTGSPGSPRAFIDPPVGGSLTFTNVTISGGRTTTAPYQDPVYIYATVTITGDFTATGTAQRPLTLFGIRGSSTINVTGTVVLTDVNLHHMTCGGTWAGTRVGDAGGNTGTITYDTPRDLYWIGNGGNWQDNSKWSTTSGGASATTYPLPQDICHFDANSFSATGQTVEPNSLWLGSINWTGVTNNPLFSGSYTNSLFCGSSYVMNTSFQMSTGGYITLSSPVTGTMTITSNGFNWDTASDGYIEINNGRYNSDIGGTFVFADDFNAPDTYLYSGGGDYVIQINNGADVTLDAWNLDGTGSTDVTHTINGTLSVANNFDNYSFTKLTYTGAGAIYLTAGGNNRLFQLSATDGTSRCGVPVYINRNNTAGILVDGELSELIVTNQFSPTLNFLDSAEINTLTLDTATLQSSVSGTPRTLTIGSADIKRAAISDITSATLIKAKNSTDSGNNTNINFIDVPANLPTSNGAIINSTTATSNVTNL